MMPAMDTPRLRPIRRLAAMAAAVLAAGLSGRAAQPIAMSQAPSAPAGYVLAWSDEFDRDGAPDPAIWTYEEGFIRNNEAQWYTRDRRENARVSNGMLVIEARRERFDNPRHDPARPAQGRNAPFAEYTSASLNTLGQRSILYGRIEVRARLPHGRGVWPAIWTLGTNRGDVPWPACGEIDIMEFVGHTPDKTHGTMHWQRDGQHASKGQAFTIDRPWDDFHVYAADWTADVITISVDGHDVLNYNVAEANQPDGSNPFRKPHYLLLNLALGGTWGREIDDSIFPQTFLVDYVRVFEKR
jgi:beta-glucanase (GH16 family)